MNEKFKVLSGVRNLLGAVGWVVVIGGTLLAAYGGFFAPSESGNSFGIENMLALGGGLAVALGGLMAVAFSEAIAVFLAIEENTRTGLR